jgi:hypothetical protein
MSRGRMQRLLIVSPLLVAVLFSGCKVYQDELYQSPPDVQDSDLVGTWVANYESPAIGTDKLIIRADGTFRQEFDNPEGYHFETPWNSWHLEKLQNGSVYVHLEGARYYDDGVRWAEKEGIGCGPPDCPIEVPHAYLDPVTRAFVYMIGELALSVRGWDSAPGGLVLKHLWADAEGSLTSAFFRTEAP